MKDFLDNGAVQTALLILAAVAILGVFGWLKFKRDEMIVAEFLKDSGLPDRNGTGSTTEIASATSLHEVRVRAVCRKSVRIKKAHKDEDRWKLHK